MPRDTKFNDDWLKSDVKDKNGDIVSEWCERVSNDVLSARCKVCCKVFSISNMGLGQIMSHSSGDKHKKSIKDRKGQMVFHIASSRAVGHNSETSEGSEQASAIVNLSKGTGNQWVPVGIDDRTRKAEALLVLKLAESNYSFSSFDSIAAILKLAFEDSEVAKHVTMSKKKAAYLISDGLGPYFQKLFRNDISHGSVPYYTIYFDETTNRQVKKQMDVHVGYWSDVFHKVTIVYIGSAFLGHADASKIESVILKFLEDNGLQHKYLLQCSMDGPSVNRAFLRHLNDRLTLEKQLPLVDLGSCSLHPVHTAFRKCIETLPFDIDQFVSDLYQWFRLSAARREDYCEVQKETLAGYIGEYFIKPVESRWLSLGPVCDRVIEQYPALKPYFLSNLRTTGMIASSVTRYKRIKESLEDPSTLVFLNFAAYMAESFNPFVKQFQTDEPMVHVLYDKANELARQCLQMFLKHEIVAGKVGADLASIDCNKSENWLPRKSMMVGSATKRALGELSADKSNLLCLALRKSVIVTAEYLVKHLPITNSILRDMQCLHPMLRTVELGRLAVGRLCNHLRKVITTDKMCDAVCSEWMLYSCDDTLANVDSSKSIDISAYWERVSTITDSTGTKKYSNLSFLAKAALTLSHSNAVPERGFSVNNSLLSKERASLSERTVIGLRVVKEAIRLFTSVSCIPVTKDMLYAVKTAHSEYAVYLENEKKKELLAAEEKKRKQEAEEHVKCIEKKKSDVREQLKQQDILEQAQVVEQNSARDLISEAAKKLAVAVQGSGSNLQNAKVAQMMLDAGNQKLTETSKMLDDIRQIKEKLVAKLLKLEQTPTTTKTSKPPPSKRTKHN
jgi:hypothetical protein